MPEQNHNQVYWGEKRQHAAKKARKNDDTNQQSTLLSMIYAKHGYLLAHQFWESDILLPFYYNIWDFL